MGFPLFFSTGFGLLCCARDPCGTVNLTPGAGYTPREQEGLCLGVANSSCGQSWLQLHQEGSQLEESLKHTPKLRGDTQTHQAELSLQDETLGNKTWGYLSLGPEVLHNLALKTVRVLLFKCHKGRWGTWNSFSGVSQNFLSKFLALN